PENPAANMSSGEEGLIGVLDLANVHSCSFLLPGDRGMMDDRGRFHVLGRWNPVDLRGCTFLMEEDCLNELTSIFHNRIEAIVEAKEYWFSSGNDYLANAVDRTVREGYFSFQDVRFALDVLEQSICKEMLTSWAVRAGLDEKKNADHQNVLCLHAGNLPLVGFQNAFATLLSGARYTGKISRKDPYLLPTFLNEVKKTALWSDMDVQWTHRLDDFEDMRHDRILFAGSETSVPEVRKAIRD